jgi:hypothetical protein
MHLPIFVSIWPSMAMSGFRKVMGEIRAMFDDD